MDKLPYDRFIKARDYIFAHSEDIGPCVVSIQF